MPAAGEGRRLGAGAPKGLVPVAGVAMVARAVAGLRDSGCVDDVVVAAPPGAHELVTGLVPHDVVVVAGGVDRVDTVDRALRSVAADVDVVLVHDAARCLCPSAVVIAVVAGVRAGHEAVVPALPVADTLRRADPDGRVSATVDRRGLVGVQTPQGFAPAALHAAHVRAARDRAEGREVAATDDAGLVEALGGDVHVVPGDPRAFKITTPLDLAMAEALVLAGPA